MRALQRFADKPSSSWTSNAGCGKSAACRHWINVKRAARWESGLPSHLPGDILSVLFRKFLSISDQSADGPIQAITEGHVLVGHSMGLSFGIGDRIPRHPPQS